MKDENVIILIVAGIAIFFWAVSSGLIKTGVNVGGGVIAPQPSTNYSGYLAAATAPGVASALNTALTGLGSAFTGWIGGGSPSPTPAPGTSASPAAVNQGPQMPPSLTQPAGPGLAAGGAAAAQGTATPIGPIVDPGLSYDATSGSAFDYYGIAADNAYDPTEALSA